MSMFDKYEDNSYTAYNLTPKKVSKTTQIKFNSPFVGYDSFHNPRMFMWDPEDSFTLKLSYGKNIKVFENDLILTQPGLKPTYSTQGTRGQHAYNTVDGKSWLCRGTFLDKYNQDGWLPIEGSDIENPEWEQIQSIMKISLQDDEEQEESSLSNSYVWEEQEMLEFPTQGTKEILINPYSCDSKFYVTLMNFRHEVIYEYEFSSPTCEIEISKEKTPLLVEGQFFINTYVFNDKTTQQQSQFNVTILENPSKYIKDENSSAVYVFGHTVQQVEDSRYVWEPIGTTYSNDYVWIPISLNRRKMT